MFALRKYRVYLLSKRPFLLLTDQQALKLAFSKNDIHGCLARLLDFLAKYDFEFQYRKGSSNKAANFLSRISHGEEGVEGADKGNLVCVMTSRNVEVAYFDNLEPTLQDEVGHFTGSLLKNNSSPEKSSIRHRAVEYV